MLLADFKKIAQLDSKILSLHSELASLYQERQVITGQPVSSPVRSQPQVKVAGSETWVNEKYDELRYAWQNLGIKIPPKKSLHTRLSKSEGLIRALNNTLNSSNAFGLLLVPPTGKISFPATKKQLGAHFDKANKVLVEDLSPKHSGSRKWQLFVVYCKTEAIPMNLLPELLENGAINIGSFRLSGLNAREYYTYALTCGNPIDLENWSLLIKDLDVSTGLVPCVRNIGERYNFSLDDVSMLLGNNTFRPAIEVV